MTTAATPKAIITQGKEREIAGAVYYDVTRSAAFLGVHPGTLKRETAKDNISHLKLGRDIWYKLEWLKEYIEERTKICFFK